MSFDKHDMTRRATAIMIQANDIVFVVVLVFLLLFWCFCCCFGVFVVVLANLSQAFTPPGLPGFIQIM